MLSEQDKREMLEDAQSASRCRDFRLMKARQENGPLSGEEYWAFLRSVHSLFPPQEPKPLMKGKDFRL